MANSSATDVSEYKYTPYYCEENVYFLCKKLIEDNADGSDFFVGFISNDKKQVPLWNQKASQRAEGLVLWDYHAVCFQRKGDGLSTVVWDLDSSLPLPSPLSSYVDETIRPKLPLFSDYDRFFRVVHAPIFLKSFASDRRHMKDPAGDWIAQPPPYDPIVSEDGAVYNLNEYMEINGHDVVADLQADAINSIQTQKLGLVLKTDQLEEFFTRA